MRVCGSRGICSNTHVQAISLLLNLCAPAVVYLKHAAMHFKVMLAAAHSSVASQYKAPAKSIPFH